MKAYSSVTKRIFLSLIHIIECAPLRINYFKMYLGEHIALFKKRKLIKKARLNNEERRALQSFWIEAYGKKINEKGHRLYYALNGVFHPNYMPDFLFATKMEHRLNNYSYAQIYSDKSLVEILFGSIPSINIPNTYVLKAGGILYDSNRNPISQTQALEILKNIGECIIKPTVGGNSGKGIQFYSFKDGKDSKTGKSTNDVLLTFRDNFIVQEIIQQHASLANIYPHSINTFRVCTYICSDKLHHAKTCLRIGSGGSRIDNIHAGGIAAGVDDQGNIITNGIVLGYSNQATEKETHPDTGFRFKGAQIVGVPNIIKAAYQAHKKTPHMGIISWDFTVDVNGKPTLIEANFIGQAVWLSQIVHKTPFFGKNTKEIIKRII